MAKRHFSSDLIFIVHDHVQSRSVPCASDIAQTVFFIANVTSRPLGAPGLHDVIRVNAVSFVIGSESRHMKRRSYLSVKKVRIGFKFNDWQAAFHVGCSA